MDLFTVSLFYLMVPGVLMALIYDKYTQHQRWDSFRYALMSVVFGVIAYLVLQLIISSWQLLYGIRDTKNINWYWLSIWKVTSQKDGVYINPIETLGGSLFAIPLGLFAVFLNKKRSIQNFLIRRGISNKYGDDNVFFRSVEDMTANNTSAYIFLPDDEKIIHGDIVYFNESKETQELGLDLATVYNSEDGSVIFRTNHIYVSKPFGNIIIFKDMVPNEDSENE